MAIVISGTPGTGKSTYAKDLGESLDRTVINITQLLSEKGLDDEWDPNRQCFLVDTEQLTLLQEDLVDTDPDVIIEGHLAHHLDPALAEYCVIMKCELKTLEKRLRERGYDDEKVRENLDCEIFDVCFVESIEFGHEPEVRWSSEE